ncbi:HEAT repeat domain-containing protein [Nostoc sp. CHAB 5834]|nr:HEAT repeat domain-containing protein [Nostoc sp. CHAB 5834]
MLKSQQEAARLRREATEQGFEINVYVPLGLVERKQQQRRQLNEDRDKEDVYKLSEEVIVKTYEHNAFITEVIAQQAQGDKKHVAIIGEPGAGKTTLLSTIASFVKDKTQDLVIYISLANLQGRTIEDYLLKQWLPEAMRLVKSDIVVTPKVERQLIECFSKGGVWLLLDGVDEIGENSPVQALAKINQELTASLRQARVVLTCRLNVWDVKVNNTLSGFDTYKTQEFKPEQIDDFIQQWFECAKDSQKGETLKAQLKENKHENICKLVKNPLRLSLLCQTFYLDKHGELPETKAALYQRFTRYFYEWKSELFPDLYQSDDLKDELHHVLSKLAFAGINSSARFRLRRSLARQEMGEKLFKLARDVGWLNLVDRVTESEEEVYAFFHPNFQEYFAAFTVSDWQDFLNDVPDNPTRGTYRIFEPQWKQTILFWLGRPEENLKQQKQQFLDALVNFKDVCGKENREDVDKGFYEYRAYFLAAVGICEFNDYGQINEIIDNIVKWTINNCLLTEEARALIQEMPRTETIDILVRHLLNLADNLANKPKEIRFYYLNNLSEAISSLEKIAIGNEKAINALIKLLHSEYVTENESCLNKVVMALNQICTVKENNINALLTFWESQGKNKYKLIQLIEKLRKKGREDKQIIRILINMIKPEDMYGYNHCQTEERLREVQNNPVLNALVQLLNLKCVSDKTIGEAASKLVKNEPNNQIGIDALVELLELADVDTDIHRLAAYSLRTIELGNQKAIDALVRRLQLMDADEDTLCEVVNSLGYIGKGNKKAIDDLAKLLDLKNIDDYTCRLVAESLGKIDPGNQKAIDALANLLASEDMDENMLRLVAENLGKIDPGNEKALETLIKLLDSTDENNGIYWLVPDSLKQILQKNQLKSVVTKLSSNLNSSQLSNYIYQDVLKHCAQNMNYPDFYNACNQGKNEEVSLNHLSSIQCLQAAINDDSQLCQSIDLICIDTSKFIDPDNPSGKIYTAIVKTGSGYPKCEDGTPKTMMELQTYWELLETDKRVVLVFHSGSTNNMVSVTYSDRFLSDISKFEGAICFMSNPIPNHNTLKFFPPNQPIDEILEWLRRS